MPVQLKGKSPTYRALARIDLAPLAIVLLLSLLFAATISAALMPLHSIDSQPVSVQGGVWFQPDLPPPRLPNAMDHPHVFGPPARVR